MLPAGRYAPSPTGDLHIGNLRTALLAWLFARSQGAPFLLRVEDIDTGRSRERFVASQLADLAALGLDWDGEVVRQSERTHLYEEALERLQEAGLVYECFCTRREIREAASAPHGPGLEGGYPGTCRHLTEAERAARRADGLPAALRIRARQAEVTVEDRLLGPVTAQVDDLVLRRTDGDWAYNLAVVVDDHDQRIGEVVRGADLLEATPSQVWLWRTLGYGEPPRYAHVPLVLGPDGRRLAKRDGPVTLADRAAMGDDPATVRDELAASVGLSERGALLSPAELVAVYDPAVLRSEGERSA